MACIRCRLQMVKYYRDGIGGRILYCPTDIIDLYDSKRDNICVAEGLEKSILGQLGVKASVGWIQKRKEQLGALRA